VTGVAKKKKKKTEQANDLSYAGMQPKYSRYAVADWEKLRGNEGDKRGTRKEGRSKTM